MSNTLVGFMLGLGVAVWVYGKIMRSSGGNVKSSMIVAASVGLGAGVVMMLVMGAIS
jgi:hypothetical protein